MENRLELMKAKLRAKSDKPSLKIAKCQLCGQINNVYYCERSHKNLFCKPCLMDTVKSDHNEKFKANCSKVDNPKGDCNFMPMNPNGGPATLPSSYLNKHGNN